MKVEDRFKMTLSSGRVLVLTGRPTGEPVIGPALLSLSDGIAFEIEVVAVEWMLKLIGGLAKKDMPRGDNCSILVKGVPDGITTLLTSTVSG
jgi:hypothetical protein